MSFKIEVEDGKSYNVLSKEGKNVNNDERTGLVDEKILHMMVKMGYKSGTGLGKNGQGIIKPVNMQVQFDRKGLDLCLKNFTNKDVHWDSSLEKINVKEELLWLENEDLNILRQEDMHTWMIKGKPLLNINAETEFIDAELLKDILKAKDIFDELDVAELSKARSRANPFETVRHAFFMNRAALKMANIDAITNFMFTNLDRDPNHRNSEGPYYFADVCAGPGGFSEYILWRKKWLYKGFGLTLKGEHDFKLHNSSCMSAVTFQPYYGISGDGDIYNPMNVSDFAEKVLQQTDGLGVHFMMSDGGFSVEGQENLQEVLSKHLYLCQCLVALEIVRGNGHFVTKLFDIFTTFSVGLIFLMYRCFEKITIIKPNSSRPANSERYLICNGLKTTEQCSQIRKYLRKIALELWNIKQSQLDIDVIEIVPLKVLKEDTKFFNYIKKSNTYLGGKQKIGLLKLAAFAKNIFLEEPRQEMLRLQCLTHWRIPDRPRLPLPKLNVDDLLNCAMSKPEFMLVQAREVNSVESFAQVVSNFKEWHYISMEATESDNCSFFIGLGSSKVAYKLQKNKWIKVKNVKLCRGTILYGELVQEYCVLKPDGEKCEVKSLHVIDALRLGDTSLADLPFHERLSCIKTYCKAANFEGVQNIIRIRPKTIFSLDSILTEPSVAYNSSANCYFTELPVLGFNTLREFYSVNSIILLKIDENQSFSSTYVLRIQVHLNRKFSNNLNCSVDLDDLRNFLNSSNLL